MNAAPISWSTLHHAYGRATDVPQQLEDLTSLEEAKRKKALHALYGNVFHQGTRYSASVHAIPALLDIVSVAPDDETRAEILNLVLHLGVGYPQFHLARGWDFANRKPTTGGASTHSGQCYLALESRIQLYRDWLRDPAPGVRMYSAYTLSFFRPAEASTLEQLRALLRSDPDTSVRSIALISVAVLSAKDCKRKPLRDLEAEIDAIARESYGSDPTLPFSAWLALAFLQQKRFSDDSISALVETTKRFDADFELAWLDGNPRAVAAALLYSMLRGTRIGAQPVVTTALEGLFTLTACAAGSDAEAIPSYLFAILFDQEVTTSLSSLQRRAIQVTLDNSSFWSQGIFDAKPCLWAPEFMSTLGLGETHREVQERFEQLTR
jgi:hypothetical protein